MGVDASKGEYRSRRQARVTRLRELRPTPMDVARRLLSLVVTGTLFGVAAYLWFGVDGWRWLAIPFAVLASVDGILLMANVTQLLRHRHPVQVSERAICNECGKVKMPWAMNAHLRGAGHEAAGAHQVGEPSQDR